MKKRIFFACLAMTATSCTTSFSQGLTAIGSLTIPKSVIANGMGGISASVRSNDPIATMENPGQLGTFSLDNYFAVTTSAPKTNWTNNIALATQDPLDMTLGTSGFEAGANVGRLFHFPFEAGVGVAYSSYLLGGNSLSESSHNLSLAIGIEYVVKLGIGYSFKSIDSKVSDVAIYPSTVPSPTVYEAKLPAHDLGAILEVPVIDLISRLNDKPIMLTDNIKPLISVTFGAAGRNIGGDVQYSGLSGVSDLPRQAIVGWNVKVGIESRFDGRPWDLLTFMWAREASDILATTVETTTTQSAGDSTWVSRTYIPGEFRTGFGGIRPFGNLLLGKTYGNITLGKGWEVQALEFLYIRAGSSTGPFNLAYSTIGGTIKLRGLLRGLSALHLVDVRTGIAGFLINHLDIDYSFSRYTSKDNLFINGMSFDALTLVVS